MFEDIVGDFWDTVPPHLVTVFGQGIGKTVIQPEHNKYCMRFSSLKAFSTCFCFGLCVRFKIAGAAAETHLWRGMKEHDHKG